MKDEGKKDGCRRGRVKKIRKEKKTGKIINVRTNERVKKNREEGEIKKKMR